MDTSAVYQGFVDLRLASYKYTEAWAALRGIDSDAPVRGVIAQELKRIAPFDARVDISSYKDGEFALENMYKVDKQGLILDLIAAVQAKHECFTSNYNGRHIAAQTSTGISSGAVSVASGNSTSGNSGHIRLVSGSTEHNSGSCKLQSGIADSVGAIAFAGALGSDGGAIFLSGGPGEHGGETTVVAGAGMETSGDARIMANGQSDRSAIRFIAPVLGTAIIGPRDVGDGAGGTTLVSAAAGLAASARECVMGWSQLGVPSPSWVHREHQAMLVKLLYRALVTYWETRGR